MNENELMNLRKRWYSEPLTLLEMVKNMQGREVAFLEGKTELPLLTKSASPVRCIKAHSLSYLLSNFNAFSFTEKPYNLYCSVATFENLPMFSYNPSKRKEEQDAFFHGSGFDLCIKGYDFVIDLDNKDLNEAYLDAKKVKKVFDEFGLKYYLKFSGSRGFHFVVKDNNFFPKELTPNEKVSLAELVIKNLKLIENIPSIDETIYQATRILKCPYSLEGFNVALPLTDEQFANWRIEDMRIDSVYQNIKLMNRGLLERPGTKDPKEFINFYGEL